MRSKAWRAVDTFEETVAAFAGSAYAVAVDSCTSAIFLCLKLMKTSVVVMPARTYISVPMAALHCGMKVVFEDYEWSGEYQIGNTNIFDAAPRFRRGMYHGGFQCVSFQSKKRLPIGRGGMILLDGAVSYAKLRKMRANGRNVEVDFKDDNIEELGWNMVMLPEQASRGLQLMESMTFDAQDQQFEYPDLRMMKVFQ